ncbi:glyoxalase/bleomycin resistance protein/dioxygenase [Alicyclobacillus hesperidum URH17-3-68]|uniref:Lactoylglutathione lyase n=1 Tax=Alicyclobacillus hesperidum TaxID=89784 RepID=A0A1H2SIF8_9BACL|nr:VOC family protein [Alicyclobacillus hesperidum]EJY55609.1 glyoxalase/bleomycin resistance protein/dioxygenase [Alicyclobacillus hesperidum URH17-3-68]SDW31426.1 lactoylglutathione lyase [Alicyclobacillus hesperidum]
MAIRKLEHTGVMVNNLEESIDFYTRILGMELKGILQHNQPGMRLAFLSFPGQTVELELIEGYPVAVAPEGQVHHLAFTVDDIEVEAERLRALGVSFIEPEITTLRNQARYIFFAGPNGEQLELFQPGTEA